MFWNILRADQLNHEWTRMNTNMNMRSTTRSARADMDSFRTTMMKLCAQAARIWSAVTCHRFCRFGDLSPKQGRVQRPGRAGRLLAFDGDKSPAESADESAHSKVTAASPRWVHPCPSVVKNP